MSKEFKVQHAALDPSGRHMIMARSEDGDVFTLNTVDKGDIEVGHVIEIEIDNLSTYEKVSASPVVVAQAAEQGQTSAGLTDAQPRQHSDSVSENEKEY